MKTYAEAKQDIINLDKEYKEKLSEFGSKKTEFEKTLSHFSPKERFIIVRNWVKKYRQDHPEHDAEIGALWSRTAEAHKVLYSLRKKKNNLD